MKCRKCGHIVSDRESKCRYCGARIIRKPLASARRAKNVGIEEDDFEPILKRTERESFEHEKFAWDTHDFPGEHRQTKNMDFDWATFDAFHSEKKEQPKTSSVHHDGDEVALLSKEEVKAAEAVTNDPADEPQAITAKPEASVPEEVAELQPEQAVEQPAEEPEEAVEISAVETEVPAYEESATTVAKTPLEELMQLEKDTEEKKASEVEEFYTFHKKNAEFQELLDREYEKYRSGRISPATERMEDAMDDARGNEDDLFSSEEKETERVTETYLPEAEPEAEELATTVTDPDLPRLSEDPKESAEENNPEPSENGTEEEKSETEAKESASDEVSEKTPAESEPDGVSEVAAEGEKTPEKRKIRGWIVALIVIVLAVALMVGIVKYAPDSGLGRLLGIAQTEQNAPVADNQDRSEAAVDKTGLIQREIDRDKNGVLGDVYYDADLKYNKSDSAKDKALAESKTLEDNSVLGTHNGKDEYLDEAIVGAVIKEVASTTDVEKPTLAIGEIRKNGNDYYVWIDENGSKKICTVKIKDDDPNVVKVRTLK